MALFGLNKKVVDIHQQEAVDGKKIDTLHISTSSTDIEILRATGDEIGILLEGEMSENLAENYEFKIIQRENKLEISFKINAGFQFGTTFSDMNLHVSLPSKMYEDLHVETSSGDSIINNVTSKFYTGISSSGSQIISGLEISNRLFLKASSGDIVTNNNRASSVMMKASSGRVNVRGLSSKDVKLETSSGDVVVHNELFDGYLKCKASSGDIRIQSDTVTGSIDCTATSGDIDIRTKNYPDSLSLDCEVTSGDIEFRVDGVNYKEKSERRVVGFKGDSGKNTINAKTTSGDITVY